MGTAECWGIQNLRMCPDFDSFRGFGTPCIFKLELICIGNAKGFKAVVV